MGEVLDVATDIGVVKKGGAWYSYGDMKLGQGRDNSKDFLAENPAIMAEIEEKIKANKAAVEEASKKAKKTSKLEEKAAAAASAAAKPEAPAAEEESFEEFAPVDVSGFGE